MATTKPSPFCPPTATTERKVLFNASRVRRRATRRLYLGALFLSIVVLYGLVAYEGSIETGRASGLSLLASYLDDVLGDYTKSTAQTSRELLSEASLIQLALGDCCVTADYALVFFYVLAAVYMFFGLAIITDDYFVPSLEIISEVLHLSEDVAGATFMAAGSSAPELFTSLVGTLIVNSDVGVGTIVGSAVFNILIIVGLTTLLSGQTLYLDWRPLTRDSVCYGGSILILLLAFLDQEVQWYETVIFLLYYAGYIGLMFKNKALMATMQDVKHATFNSIWGRSIDEVPSDNEDPEPFKVKPIEELFSEKDGDNESEKAESNAPKTLEMENMSQSAGAASEAGASTRSLPPPGPRLRQGSVPGEEIDGHVQVFTPERNPFVKKIWGDAIRRRSQENLVEGGSEAKVDGRDAGSEGKAENGTPDAGGAESPDFDAEYVKRDEKAKAEKAADSEGNAAAGGEGTEDGGTAAATTNNASEDGEEGAARDGEATEAVVLSEGAAGDEAGGDKPSHANIYQTREEMQSLQAEVSMLEEELKKDDAELDAVEALIDEDFSPDKPKGWKKILKIVLSIIYWVLAMPYKIMFWLTVPPCGSKMCGGCCKWFFPITFANSIIWIGILSFFMVDLASRTGDVLGIPTIIMGLTFVAAGTSVPDSLSSISVAREGLGDMAIANALGSNVFDICFGLAFPWFCKSVFVPDHGSSIDVGDGGRTELLMFVSILFGVLFWVYGIILIRSFALAPVLGIIFLVTYALFVIWCVVWTYVVSDLV